MDSDGQDNPKGILKMINFADREKGFSVAANRGQRSEALWFKICYEIYCYFILFFSFKNTEIGRTAEFSVPINCLTRKGNFRRFCFWSRHRN